VPWHSIEPVSRIPEGRVLPFTVGGRLLAVGRTSQGLFAVDGVCPHAGGSLGEGEIDGECVICPIHGFAYDVRSGRGLDDDARVRVYETKLEGDVLLILLPD
jgi:nitrite reductase (NADH) small subunit